MRRLLAAIAVLVGAVPLVVARPAPFVDWPNHLARVLVGTQLLRGDAHWSAFYAINASPVPNEALDLGIGALVLAGVPLDLAASLFLLLAYAAFVGGVCRLARAFGALDASKPVLASCLFLTGPLMFGLVNYVLGLGLALGLAGIALDGPPWRRWTVAVAGTLALFYVHLLAAGILVLLLGCADLALLARGRATLGRVGSSLAAAALFVGALLASSAGADSMPRADASNIWYPGHDSVAATLAWKGGIFVRMLTDHATWAGTFVAILGVLAFLVLARRPRFAPAAALTIAAGLALVLVLPESAGTGSLLDYRLALMPLAVAAAACWRDRPLPRAAFAVLVALAVARSADFALAFTQQGEVVAAFESAAARLPGRTMLLVARGRTDEEIGPWAWWAPPMEHVGTRAVRSGVFVPTVFAVASQQPVVLRPEFAPWRHEWRIATDSELAAMLRDVAPLCAAVADRTGPGGVEHVALLEVYPGTPMRDALDPSALIAQTAAFRLLDPCAVVNRPS